MAAGLLPEVGDEVQAAAEGFDVAGVDLGRGNLAFQLRIPGVPGEVCGRANGACCRDRS